MRPVRMVFIVVFAGLLSCGKGGGPQKAATPDTRDRLVAEALPSEYTAYRGALTGDNGTGDARAALSLLSEARDALVRSQPAGTIDYKAKADAYWGVWRICLRTMQASKDEEPQQLLLAEWKECLLKGGDIVRYQLYALHDQWDRRLLTDEYWRVLRDAQEKKALSAIGFSMYLNGSREDYEKLQERYKSEKNEDLRMSLEPAIAYMYHRLYGDKSPGGQAMIGPHPEY